MVDQRIFLALLSLLQLSNKKRTFSGHYVQKPGVDYWSASERGGVASMSSRVNTHTARGAYNTGAQHRFNTHSLARGMNMRSNIAVRGTLC